MAKIELNTDTQITAEIVDALKAFATQSEDGKMILDTDTLKTQADIQNVMRAKNNADNELRGVKQQLADAQGRLKNYTDVFGDGDPGAIHAELEELRKGSGDSQKRMVEAVQNAKAWEKKFNDQQPEFEKYKLAAEKQAERERMDNIEKIWAKKRESLDPKWSKRKADTLFQNIKDRINIADDDPEDFAPMQNGQKFEQYMVDQLDLFDAYADMNRGKGNPGSGSPENGKGATDMFTGAASQIKL